MSRDSHGLPAGACTEPGWAGRSWPRTGAHRALARWVRAGGREPRHSSGVLRTCDRPRARDEVEDRGGRLCAQQRYPYARLRYAIFAVPNQPYTLELDELTGIERKSVQANHNDPGSSFLNFGVWAGPAAFDGLRKAHPALVGRGKIPEGVESGRMAAVWFRDPDGHLIELMQGGWDSQRKSLSGVRNVYRSHFGVTLEHY